MVGVGASIHPCTGYPGATDALAGRLFPTHNENNYAAVDIIGRRAWDRAQLFAESAAKLLSDQN